MIRLGLFVVILALCSGQRFTGMGGRSGGVGMPFGQAGGQYSPYSTGSASPFQGAGGSGFPGGPLIGGFSGGLGLPGGHGAGFGGPDAGRFGAAGINGGTAGGFRDQQMSSFGQGSAGSFGGGQQDAFDPSLFGSSSRGSSFSAPTSSPTGGSQSQYEVYNPDPRGEFATHSSASGFGTFSMGSPGLSGGSGAPMPSVSSRSRGGSARSPFGRSAINNGGGAPGLNGPPPEEYVGARGGENGYPVHGGYCAGQRCADGGVAAGVGLGIGTGTAAAMEQRVRSGQNEDVRMYEQFASGPSAGGPGGMPGMGGMPGIGGMPGMGGGPGMGGVPGMGGAPGMGGIPGMGGAPGMGGIPGMGGMPGAPLGGMRGHIPGVHHAIPGIPSIGSFMGSSFPMG